MLNIFMLVYVCRKYYKEFIKDGCKIKGTRYSGEDNSSLKPQERAKRFTLYLQTCRNVHHGKDTTYLAKTFFRQVLPVKRSRPTSKSVLAGRDISKEDALAKKAKQTVEDTCTQFTKVQTVETTVNDIDQEEHAEASAADIDREEYVEASVEDIDEHELWDAQVNKAKTTIEKTKTTTEAEQTQTEKTIEQSTVDDIVKILAESHLRGPAKESALMEIAERIKVNIILY